MLFFPLLALVPAEVATRTPERLNLLIEMAGAPAVFSGRTLVATRGGLLACLDDQGKLLWQKEGDQTYFASPLISAKGEIFIGAAKGRVLSLNLAGKILWQAELAVCIRSTPLVLGDALYLFGDRCEIFKLDRRSGRLLWKKELHLPILGSPVFDRDRKQVIVPVEDFYCAALDLDGGLKWKIRTVGANHATPAVSRHNEIYLTSMDHTLYKFSADGRLLWKFTTTHWINSSPVIDRSGNVYFCGYDRKLHSITPEGRERWAFTGLADASATAVIGEGDVIYYGDSSGTVYAVSAAGQLLWSSKNEDFVRSGLTIVPGSRTLLAGCINGMLFRYKIAKGMSNAAWWPKLLGNLRNSGYGD